MDKLRDAREKALRAEQATAAASVTTLVLPTVEEVIRHLQSFDPSAPLRICDPDTGWTISTIHVSIGEQPRPEIVWLTGVYHEMTKDVE